VRVYAAPPRAKIWLRRSRCGIPKAARPISERPTERLGLGLWCRRRTRGDGDLAGIRAPARSSTRPSGRMGEVPRFNSRTDATTHRRGRGRDVAERHQEALKRNSIREGLGRDLAEDHQEALKRNSLH
jgi:hypothetical protein